MTYYEMLMHEYLRLPVVIKDCENKIARLQKRYTETEDEHLRKCCVNDIKSEMALIERNKKRLEELAEALRINDSMMLEDNIRETSGTALLCDKVWNRRSNR